MINDSDQLICRLVQELSDRANIILDDNGPEVVIVKSGSEYNVYVFTSKRREKLSGVLTIPTGK